MLQLDLGGAHFPPRFEMFFQFSFKPLRGGKDVSQFGGQHGLRNFKIKRRQRQASTEMGAALAAWKQSPAAALAEEEDAWRAERWAFP
jgi:hypothetical protein